MAQAKPEEVSDAVQDQVGFALYQAQVGLKHRTAKPLKGLGANVLEVISRQDGDTIGRCVRAAIYVLHPEEGQAVLRHRSDLVKQAQQRHYADTYGEG